MFIDLTKEAKDKLVELTKDEEVEGKKLRVYIAGYSWAGPSFNLALDELKEGDIEINEEGLDFIIEDSIADIFNKISIDYKDGILRKGFAIIPS